MDLQSVGLDLLLIASIFAGFHIMGDWVRGYALWEHHLKSYFIVRKEQNPQALCLSGLYCTRYSL